MWCAWLLALNTGCVSPYDRGIKSLSYGSGKSETDIIRDLGQPDSRVTDVNDSTGCRFVTRDAKAALEYFVPHDGIGASFRNVLHLRPSMVNVVCLDGQGRILGTFVSMIN